jgi:hypothetical protein
MSNTLHSVDNSLFVTNNQNSVTDFSTKEINLSKNLISRTLQDGAFFPYLDGIAQYAISSIDQKGLVIPSNTVNLVTTLADAGKTFLLVGTAANLFVFLPPMSIDLRGCRFTFILVSVNTGGGFYQLNTNNPAVRIFGHIYTATAVTGGGTSAAGGGNQFLNFTGNVANTSAMDRIDIISDGSNWFAIGKQRVLNGIFFS